MAVPQSNKSVDWAGYEALSLDAPKSIVWASAGQDGSGKSTFGLTAPGPIWVAAFDTHGMNRVGRQFKVNADGSPKDIRISRYSFNPRPFIGDAKKCSDAASGVWEQFIADYRVATLNARTVLVDREDIAFEILRYANFGDLQSAAKNYGPLNVELTSLVQEAFAAGINLGLLRGVKEQWESKMNAKGVMAGVNTGKLIPDGWKRAPDVVDVTLFHYWDAEAKAFTTRIDKFTEASEKGQEYPDLTFPLMATLAYPDTDLSDWEA